MSPCHTSPLVTSGFRCVTDVSVVTGPAAGVFNAVRGGGDEKEEEKKDSGLDVGNILQKVTGGNDNEGGECAPTTASRPPPGAKHKRSPASLCA